MEYSPKLAAVLLLALASAMIVTAQNSPDDFVAAHNAARADVNVAPVSWDNDVAAWAQAYADERRADCQLMHSPDGRPYGENLFWGGGATWTAADAVNSWVAEKQYYDHDSNSCSPPAGESCGHYTQVVWRDSTTIGCARNVCDSGDVFIICSYNPKGNWDGQSPY